jgi:hypothetical protein
MEKLNRRELDAITGKELIIELTQEEIVEREELAKVNESARAAETLAKATAKASLLNRLGITEEEAALLIGGN